MFLLKKEYRKKKRYFKLKYRCFHLNNVFYMKKLSSISSKYNDIFNKSIKDIPKLNEAIQKGFNIISFKEVNEKIDFSIAKPFFYDVSQKISSNYFSSHYSNFSGFFTAGEIYESQLFPVPVLDCKTHTSCQVSKYFNGKKK